MLGVAQGKKKKKKRLIVRKLSCCARTKLVLVSTPARKLRKSRRAQETPTFNSPSNPHKTSPTSPVPTVNDRIPSTLLTLSVISVGAVDLSPRSWPRCLAHPSPFRRFPRTIFFWSVFAFQSRTPLQHKRVAGFFY